MRLVGRGSEQQAIDSLLEGARKGLSSALMLRGEPGIGKTALLDYAAESAAGFQVLRVAGVESEMELGFAALEQLCRPMLAHLDRLPDPQATALGVSLGLGSGESPDRFLVGLAVLTLLSELSEEGPVLCIVDDAQWLDRASAQLLGFVARRLEAESVVLLLGTRPGSPTELSDLPELALSGLSDADAARLLASALTGRFDQRVQDRIVAEAQGNPLALFELPRASMPTELAGGFAIPDSAAVAGRVQESFRQRIERLPPPTQRLLLLAAAEPLGDPDLLRAAARRLGLSAGAEGPAEAAGLLRVQERVAFRHPLVRSAVYGAAGDDERRVVHRAIAEVTDPEADPDRRAWHEAAASVEPDEEVAEALERSAERARARGGVAAAAAFLERATELTPDRGRRARRAVAAAEAKLMAGSPDAARQLAALAEAGPLDPLDCARLELLVARTAIYPTYRADAPSLLVKAATRLAPLNAALSRETYLDAIQAATSAGRFGEEGGLRAAAEAALAAPPAPEPPRPVDLLLDGLSSRFTGGPDAGIPALQRALAAFGTETNIRWLLVATRTAIALGDDETWHILSDRLVQLARQTGSLGVLPMALRQWAILHTFAGRLEDAQAAVDEADAISAAIGAAPIAYGRVVLAAWRGRLPETMALVEDATRHATARKEGLAVTAAAYATAVQHIGLGHYEKALEAALDATDSAEALYAVESVPDVIEAAVRSNNPDVAAAAMEQLSAITQTSRTEWALGLEARSRALLCDDRDQADKLYREAIERLERTTIITELARAHLLYGEWLRRERRRTDAREHLRTAHEMFCAMGAEAFADRVARELHATGERARRRSLETTTQLTPQQTQVARLASEGHSNSEIGAQLFISPRTVEYHLRNVFIALGINSRAQLARVLT
jgi:DNA-binding CsgD family transcriptional regulator/tetratricopeptide (TPR) repeat protein